MFFEIWFFLMGLAMGSFLNCVAYRLGVGKSPWKGRSFCPKCKKTIAWYDNIPLLSFFLLRGHCRSCQGKISWQYPLVELAGGLLWLCLGKWALAQEYGLGKAVVFLSWWSILGGILLTDLLYMVVASEMVLLALVVAMPLVQGIWWDHALAMILGSLFFAFLHLVTKGKGMGWGDVELALPLGFFLGGQKTILAFYLAFLLGAAVGLGLVWGAGKSLKAKVPFGPFMIAGTAVSFFWGDWIIVNYQKLLVIF